MLSLYIGVALQSEMAARRKSVEINRWRRGATGGNGIEKATEG